MEKVYVIPLRDAFLAPRTHRASKAIKVVRAFLTRHLKSESIRLGKSINESVWARGIQKVPRKIRVHADKDENGIYLAEIMGVEIKFPVTEEAKPEEKAEPSKKTETAAKPSEKKAAEPQKPAPKAHAPAAPAKPAGKK